MEPLRIDAAALRYRGLIGTGGIGSGVFFALNGDHTLGREESRSGRFLNRRDYCKLHIVAHYVGILTGPDFTVLPIGLVGDDDHGRTLREEMAQAGLDTRHVGKVAGKPTLHCVCFVYPDGSGGNLTVDDSACSDVNAEAVAAAEDRIADLSDRGMVAALPEVPLDARRALLELGTRHGSYRAASFTSEEIVDARDGGLLEHVDLLAINVDEASALAATDPGLPAKDVVEVAASVLDQHSSDLRASFTAGADGSWVWDGEDLTHEPAHPVEVVGTAGAGDAHFAGLLTGLAAGLSLGEAQSLGALAGALSVTSPHTINDQIDRRSLKALADALPAALPEAVQALLE